MNVHAGIIEVNLIEPFCLLGRLNGYYYRRFLRSNLPIILEDVFILIRNRISFMDDGAAAHLSAEVGEN